MSCLYVSGLMVEEYLDAYMNFEYYYIYSNIEALKTEHLNQMNVDLIRMKKFIEFRLEEIAELQGHKLTN